MSKHTKNGIEVDGEDYTQHLPTPIPRIEPCREQLKEMADAVQALLKRETIGICDKRIDEITKLINVLNSTNKLLGRADFVLPGKPNPA